MANASVDGHMQDVAPEEVDREKAEDAIDDAKKLLDKLEDCGELFGHNLISIDTPNKFKRRDLQPGGKWGDADKQFNIGTALICGAEGHKNLDGGIEWLELAAKQGHEEAKGALEEAKSIKNILNFAAIAGM
jgi:TPR repeat protein